MDPAAAEAQAVLASPAAFDALVARLMAQDNDTRKAAELAFDQVKRQPDACVRLLLHTLRQSAAVEHRSFSAIMLRKVRSVRRRARNGLGGAFGAPKKRGGDPFALIWLFFGFFIPARSLAPLSPSLTPQHNTTRRSSRATSPACGPSVARRCR